MHISDLILKPQFFLLKLYSSTYHLVDKSNFIIKYHHYNKSEICLLDPSTGDFFFVSSRHCVG